MDDLIQNEETGDFWRWRNCEECNGVVIERWFNPGKRKTAEQIDLDSPDDAMDVPLATFEIIAEQVLSARDAK